MLGVVIDYTESKVWVLSISLWSIAATSIFCCYLQSFPAYVSTLGIGILLGINEGTAGVATSYIPAYLFGRKNLGSIFGVTVSLCAVGSGSGPIALALSKDYIGSFSTFLFPLGCVQVALGALCLCISKPTEATTPSMASIDST